MDYLTMLEHNDAFQFKALPPLGLYIHVPWCVKKCPYCDFNSHTHADDISENDYIDALLRDLETELPQIWGRTISSIFIGGGTPSLFSAKAYERLLSELRARLTLNAHVEITLEANPGTAEAQRFADYRALGINRLSIGVQSFNDDYLSALGRIHSSTEAIKAIEYAQQAGFERINIDLMYGLPEQSIPQALADLETAISIAPQHISHYQLTIEPNTLFHHQPPTNLPDNDKSWDMQLACQDKLAAKGFAQYEVSAYARPGEQCQHNLNYWTFGDYLGIGAGAHAKITTAQPAAITRSWKHKQPADYMARAATQSQTGGTTLLSANDAILEFMMNALRLKDGFELDLFCQHTGLPDEHIQIALMRAEAKGWLTNNRRKITPTPTGRQYLNDLVEIFMGQ